MKKIRFGIIGCGNITAQHSSRFEPLQDVLTITGLADIELGRARELGDKLSSKPICATDYHDILPHVDAVMISLPHHLHHQVGIECLRAGKHVLMEKPLANKEAECINLIKTSKAAGKILMVAYCMRFHPLLNKMKELINQKYCGELFQLSIWTEQHTERDKNSWMCKADTLGGGQFFSHGCHYIDLMLDFVNSNPVRGSHIGTNRGTPWMEREGTSNVSIEFENGTLGYHFGTWGARGTRLGYAFHAHCDGGMLEAALHEGKLYCHRNTKLGDSITGNAPELIMSVQGLKNTEAETRHFVDCIINGTQPLTDPVTSLEGLQVIWKLYEAEDKHQLADLRGLGFGSCSSLR
ncbi:MAG: Gfo/Idh/MocA family oxidoreductase [Victivallales bacterium]